MNKKIAIIIMSLCVAPAFAYDVEQAPVIMHGQQNHEYVIEKGPSKIQPGKQKDIVMVNGGKKTFSTSDAKIKAGASQETVLNALGEPSVVANAPDGTQVWVYDKVSSVTYTTATGYTVPNGAVMTPPSATFNAQIATNGFGRNMFTGSNTGPMYSAPQPIYETKTVRIKFDANNLVEKFMYGSEEF